MPKSQSYSEQYPSSCLGASVQSVVPGNVVSASAAGGTNASPAITGLTIAANGTFTSNAINADGYPLIGMAIQSTQAGTASIQRYLDDTGTIPQGTAISATLTANTLANINASDGLPFASFIVTVTNSSGSVAATLSNFVILLQAGGGGSSSGGGGGGSVTQGQTPWVETSNANTSGGTSTYAALGGTGNALLTNTAVAVKASAGNLYGVNFVNKGTADAYVQVFDAATGSVTLGTTVPKLSFWVPAGGSWEEKFANEGKISFGTAITVAATTTATGSTAPGTGISANITYK